MPSSVVALGNPAAWPIVAESFGPGLVGYGLAGAALAAGGVALFLALQARRMAADAAQEAGHARARAGQAQPGAVSADALAAAERVWASRFTALEAQLATPGARAAIRPSGAAAPDLAARLEHVERLVSSLDAALKELRRAPSAAAVPAEKSVRPVASSEVRWPAVISADTPPLRGVREALGDALKAGNSEARDLLTQLQAAERWPANRPSSAELAAELQVLSTVLLSSLRHGAAREPLDAALLAERVLAALRPLWKTFRPHLDCRSVLPGTTVDPDWMEDRSAAAVHRPIISEMQSWAVFEKLDSGRRVLAKARVLTD